MGAGVRGNRVIGATDEGVRPLTVNPSTLELDPSSNGIRITPAHIHASLRQHFGVDQHTLSGHYPLEESPLPLFM